MAERSRFYEWWRREGESELSLILWALWDPIGRVPRDEYDWYVPRLWKLLTDHARVLKGAPADDEPDAVFDEWSARVRASEGAIARQLSEWRTERMCLPACPEVDRAVAKKLSDWLSPAGFGACAPIDLIDATE